MEWDEKKRNYLMDPDRIARRQRAEQERLARRNALVKDLLRKAEEATETQLLATCIQFKIDAGWILKIRELVRRGRLTDFPGSNNLVETNAKGRYY